ncbi:Surfactant protein B containing protein [Rhynchospora pubera]|uniref:Pulmonary surfactant-associated protein B n=1 Tax=Rhynchospora pubera TaxID=906938 RepID=A0AAV8ENA4_9POAL|nr:Surfactant protein B containing protein [Rhynchospora pubera]
MGSKQGLLFLLLVFCWTIANARTFVSTDIIVTEYVVVAPKLKNNEVCTVCENFTTQAIEYMAENKTQEEIIKTLHHACSQIKAFEEECISLVNYYASLFFNEISKIKPKDFCKEVNLCESSLSYYKNALRTNGNSTCEFCHHMIDEILTKLKDPDAQFEILEMLLKECSKFQNHVQQCKRLVIQYTPLILMNGEKFLEKNDICSAVRACHVSKEPSIESVVPKKASIDA